MADVRAVSSSELSAEEVTALRALLRDAFAGGGEEFSDQDWEHALGGVHFILEREGVIAAHASVVERELNTNDRRLVTGYVEAVATRPGLQRRGHGTAVMRAAGEHIDRTFQLGALDSGLAEFYERLGWVRWDGPTFVRTESGLARTPEEDGFVFVRLTPTSPDLDLSAPISCDWRPGDVW